MEAFAWSARRGGTPETGETRVVVLITLRRAGQHGSRVNALTQIQPDNHRIIAVAEEMATASATSLLSK